MAPTFQAVGAQVASTGASVNVAWPTHLADDIGLVVIETSGNSANLTPPTGWAAVPGTPVTDVATTAGSKLHVWWKRAVSSAEAAVATGAATDHIVARLYTFRGCVTVGNPWDVTTTGTKTTASTTATVPALVTTVDDTLITMVVGRPNDNASTTHFGVPVNANLTGLAEAGEAGTTSGNGGGFVVSYGVEPTASTTGTSTLTKIASTTDTYVVLALKAPVVFELICNTGTFNDAGVDVGLIKSSIIHGTTQTYSVVGNDVDLSKSVSLDLTTGTYSVVGNLLDPNVQRAIVGTTGTFNLAGVNTLLQRAARIDATTRTYDLAGTTTTVAFNRALVNQTGTFTIAGVQVDLTYIPIAGATFTLINDTGIFSVSGISSQLLKNSVLINQSAAYVLSGKTLGLVAALALNTIKGTYAVSGQQAILGYTQRFNLNTGTFTIGSSNLSSSRLFTLNSQPASYYLNGNAAALLATRRVDGGTLDLTVFGMPLEAVRRFPLLLQPASFNLQEYGLDYFATRTLNASTLNLVVYVQTRDIVYRPNRQPTLPTPVPTGRNQWILGKFTSGGKGSFRL